MTNSIYSFATSDSKKALKDVFLTKIEFSGSDVEILNKVFKSASKTLAYQKAYDLKLSDEELTLNVGRFQQEIEEEFYKNKK